MAQYEPKVWYSVRWYDASEQEHYWCGGWNKKGIYEEANKALEISFIKSVKIFANDRFLDQLIKEV